MWIAETEQGVFEENTLKKLSDDMANYYAQDDGCIGNICEVYFENYFGIRSKLSLKGLRKFTLDCEETSLGIVAADEEEAEMYRQRESDYYASVL